MSSISGVAGSAYSSSLSQIASGIKLQSAADGASEMAIVEKQNAQINGLNMGERNAQASRAKLKQLGIPLLAEDTGLNYGRTVELYPETGEFRIKAVGKSIKSI